MTPTPGAAERAQRTAGAGSGDNAGLAPLGFLLLLGELLLLQGFLRSLLLLFLGVLGFHGDVTGLSLPASAGGVVAVVA